MHLTTDQINYIDYVLKNDYSFEKFDDLRIELLDHIASDVEEFMSNSHVSFEAALPEIFHKWNDEIAWNRNSKYKTVPKMVSNLWGKLDWKYNYSVIPITVIIFFVTLQFRREDWVTYGMYLVGFFGVVLGSYLLILSYKNQFNTVLSNYVKDKLKLYFGYLIVLLMVNLGVNYMDGDLLSRPSFVFIVQLSLVFFMRTIIMRKNIKIENQLLKVI